MSKILSTHVLMSIVDAWSAAQFGQALHRAVKKYPFKSSGEHDLFQDPEAYRFGVDMDIYR